MLLKGIGGTLDLLSIDLLVALVLGGIAVELLLLVCRGWIDIPGCLSRLIIEQDVLVVITLALAV